MKQNFTKRLFKNYLIFFLFISLSFNYGHAQVLLASGFEDAVIPAPPTGWVVTHTGTANWQSLKSTGGGNQYEGRKCMYLANSYNGDQSDAWLILPAITVQSGKKYSISFYYKNQSYTSNTLQVTIGNDASPASQTNVLWTNKYATDYYAKAQINYTATESGTKYIAVHCISPKTYTYIYIDNVEIKKVSTFAPLDILINNVTTTTANASWDKVAGASGYLYGINDSMVAPKKTIVTNSNMVTLSALKAAKKYFLFVKTIDAQGQSSDWAIKDFVTAYDTTGIEIVTCGKQVENNFTAIDGLYLNVFCYEPYFGKEFFHKFIPVVSGYYNIDVPFVNTGQYMEFAYKEFSAGAGPDGWTCIGSDFGDFGGKASFGPLVAGKEYLILEKPKASPGFPSGYAYTIECYNPPPPNDSCQNATEITPMLNNDTCKGVQLTTRGATQGSLKENFNACGGGFGADDEIWIKFTAIADMQLFRIQGMKYESAIIPNSNPGIYFNIFDKPCNLKSLVDCGFIPVDPKTTKDFFSYKLKKGKTYYCRISTADNFTYASFRLCIMNLAVSNGTPNACTSLSPYPIDMFTDGGNINTLVPFTDGAYKLVAGVNANNNTLNYVSGGFYINDGPLRKDGNGVYYLNRNVSLQPDAQPTSTIKVRIYLKNEELQKLINKPGSGVTSIHDIRVTQNNDSCSSKFVNLATAFIVPTFAGDYDADNKLIEFETDHLSSFYLHGGNVPLVPATNTGNNIFTSVSSSVKQSILNIFPNPFTDKLTVTAFEFASCTYSFIITDMQGYTIKQFAKKIEKGSNNFVIETASLKAGVYLVKIQKPGNIEYRKVIKL